jgi:diacylglycerol kinase (ATP)
MRAAAIFGLGSSLANLKPFQANSRAEWLQGLPSSSSGADAILIFGGDGTIHRHLPALVRLQLPILIVPTGSGNDFARALNLRSPQDSLRTWREFEFGRLPARAIDLGVILPSASPAHPHYFCGVAACGLDSIAAKRANQMPRWLRGHGGYVLAALPLLAKLPIFSMRLTPVGGSEPGLSPQLFPSLLAAFANTQFYGDGMRIAPKADFTDGKLDICRIAQLSARKLLSVFPTVYFGRHLLLREVEYSRVERVVVETDPPMEIYADGEFVCETPAEISIAAAALPLIWAAK